MQVTAFGGHPYSRFMLDHGNEYTIGPKSFAGERAEPGSCFKNASMLAFASQDGKRALAYVEGQIAVHGVPIDHAWCVNGDGVVIDPTLTPDERGNSMDYVAGYFGVPFQTDYVRKAVIRNGYYGVLNVMYARKTLPKLIELGLEDGQQWLLRDRRKGRKA
jgi:hypothetical protein